ncbi:NAM2 [Candida metapsilosis]|uniref:leucine--tRNA ligase n=1 Tax=Candida metapsilosis TaxID=273372 RepID=A0A8H8DDJ4_9ASCO|nr:NAM2 [Candida metapsilosis]
MLIPLQRIRRYQKSCTILGTLYSQRTLANNYNFVELDKKWRDRWSKQRQQEQLPSQPPSSKDKDFYALVMFPYPSGMLHMGHLRVYTISDVVARYKKLNGFNVIHPMGWDAFGLPAENAAIERDIDPAIWTDTNISKMKQQMINFSADFDWNREINTSSPDYYKWTQKIFLMLYERGLAYRKKAEINWDPVDQTVLANEQVDAKGRSWRSGAVVEKRNLEQWFIGITKYADRLVEDLDYLKQWPEHVKTMQRNWIGKSNGCVVKFPVNQGTNAISVFTSRPETLFAVQFLALSLDHPLVKEASKSDPGLVKFIEESRDAGFESKAGYKLPIKATIPLNPDNSKKLVFDVPIYVAPYVLSEYGSGAVMGCPGHDTRDFEFWKLHEPNQPTIQVIGPKDAKQMKIPYTLKKGIMQDNTTLEGGLKDLHSYKGLTGKDASNAVTQQLTAHGLGNASTQYRLKDWLISRQRYWGAPIPIIHCSDCGPVPVPDDQLPVHLPKVNSKHFTKGNPLGNIDEFVNCKCPSCGKDAKRETDTMDTFMDSSWYYLRYLDSKNEKELISSKASENMPVDLYVGGVEHAILHLLYARFIAKFLSDCGVWNGKNCQDEPLTKLVTQGMVHGITYADPDTNKFLKPEEVDLTNPQSPVIKSTGKTAKVSYEKMSKSKYNGADPGECIAKYGADATRAQMLFSAPVSDTLLWNEDQIAGVDRWLRRVLALSQSITSKGRSVTRANGEELAQVTLRNAIVGEKIISLNEYEFGFYNQVQDLVKSIADSIDLHFSLNTVVSDLMKMTNCITDAIKSQQCSPDLILDSYMKLLICMSPVTPSTSEECWESVQLANGLSMGSIFNQSYPTDESIKSNVQKYNIFINGKARGTIMDKDELIKQDDESIVGLLRGKDGIASHLPQSVKKVIKKPGLISVIG